MSTTTRGHPSFTLVAATRVTASRTVEAPVGDVQICPADQPVTVTSWPRLRLQSGSDTWIPRSGVGA